MLKYRAFIFYFLVFVLWSCGDKKEPENEIILFCAASLSPVIKQIKRKWEKDHHEKIIINGASSGILARQIENGAQADIFLSANLGWMEYLVNAMTIKNHPLTIASNGLVVVVPSDVKVDTTNFNELIPTIFKQNGKISIGDPGHVPLGKYTKESLEFYQIYNEFSSALILAKDARNALMLVELGEASFGFVYLSDAISSKKAKIVSVIPEVSHQPINYQGIIVNDKNPGVKEFFKFLSSEETKEIWVENGFIY